MVRGLLEVLLLVLSIVCVLGTMEVVHRWKSPDFLFPSEAAKRALTASGSYQPNTGVILDVDRDRRGRTFVTLPNFSNGTSVTLATVANPHQVDSPLLQPYPDWSWHQKGNCNGLTSVFRIKIDHCNRLWALDSGVVDVFGSYIQACPARLLVFDLNRDVLIKRYIFPQNVLQQDSLPITIEVEASEMCSDTYAYVADVVAYKLIVYHMESDRSWVVNSRAFYPNTNYENFSIAGSQFQIQDGLFALTLSPMSSGGRTLFFHSLASNCESSVRTSVLKNARSQSGGPLSIDNQVRNCFGTRRAQSAAEAMDSRGILFSSNLTENAVDCWNWNTPFSQRQVVKSDPFLQFISGMKVIRGPNGEELWAISSRFQKIATETLNRREYNFHILRGSTEALARKGGCESSGWWWWY
ncbi:dopaminechrome tautomerase [Anabrus simplex]|uniref:dopaminechrome tautomerase n=1 Tax=Anabrus simplex TaxID=316456 RepID=UPI0035A38EE7